MENGNAEKPQLTLSDEQAAAIHEHLDQNTELLDEGCPACGETDQFIVRGSLVFTHHVSLDGDILQAGMPFYQVHCRNCRHTLFFECTDIEEIDVGTTLQA